LFIVYNNIIYHHHNCLFILDFNGFFFCFRFRIINFKTYLYWTYYDLRRPIKSFSQLFGP